MNNLIDRARQLPIRDAVQTISISPVSLAAEGRGAPLEMRITLPTLGSDLPILLFSHGDGPSLYLPSKDGYGPLVARGRFTSQAGPLRVSLTPTRRGRRWLQRHPGLALNVFVRTRSGGDRGELQFQSRIG